MKSSFKKSVVFLSIAVAVLWLALGINMTNSNAEKYTFDGQTSNVTTNLTVNGVDTGADWTQIKVAAGTGIASGSSVGALINIVEANLSTSKLTFEVVNHGTSGDYISGSETLSSAISRYSEGNKQIVAAVNGDWMMRTQADLGLATSKNYYVTVSALMLEGELWASQITAKEPVNGAPYDGPYSIGITNSNKPVVGQLEVEVVMKNTATGQSVKTDGLNRSPANDAIIVFNERIRQNNEVPTDTFEIIVKTNGTNKFFIGQDVTGTVESVVPAGTTTRRDNADGYLIITARGSRISELESAFPQGSPVSISATLRDAWGRNDDLWADCREIIGGHILVLKDGVVFDTSLATNTGNYPSNIIGVKEDGTVMMTMITADVGGSRAPFQFSEMASTCEYLGYDTCFLFDGGGSTTMVTLEGTSFVSRANSSDDTSNTGVQRSTWNSFALVYDETITIPTPTPTAAPTPSPTPEPQPIEVGLVSGADIARISAGTSYDTITKEYKTVFNVKNVEICDSSYKKVDKKATITTGMFIRANNVYYPIIIEGDVNCDGAVDSSDAEAVLEYIRSGSGLSDTSLDAVAVLKGRKEIDILNVAAIMVIVFG